MKRFTASHALLFFLSHIFLVTSATQVPHPHTIHQGSPMHGRCSMPTGKTAGRRRGAHHQKKKSGNPWDGLEHITNDLLSVPRDEREVHYIHHIHYTCWAPGIKKTLEEVLRRKRMQGVVEPSMLFAAGVSGHTSALGAFSRDVSGYPRQSHHLVRNRLRSLAGWIFARQPCVSSARIMRFHDRIGTYMYITMVCIGI
jgi:hypothetical protein